MTKEPSVRVQALAPVTDQDEVPDSFDRIQAEPAAAPRRRSRTVSPCRSPRSVRSGAAAVGATGLLAIVIPIGLLLGKNGLVTASVNRTEPIPVPRAVSCATGQPLPARALRPGQCTHVVGSGFEPGEVITVSDSRRPTWSTFIRADDEGRFSLRHLIPAAAGPEVLTFVGDGEHTAVVPRVAYFRLVVSSG